MGIYIGKSAVRPAQRKKLEALLKKTKFVAADKDISKRVGVLMRDFPNLYLADALVAATALVKKAPLCTFNKPHFEKVSSLEIY